jgi:hypothetical protein
MVAIVVVELLLQLGLHLAPLARKTKHSLPSLIFGV